MTLVAFFVFAEHLYVICPYLVAVVSSEYFVDWIKHAFITKFNNIPVEVSYIYIFFLLVLISASAIANDDVTPSLIVARVLGFRV